MENTRISTGKTVLGAILAGIFGLGASGAGLALGFQGATMIMLLPFTPIFMMAFYGFAGAIAPFVLAIALCAGSLLTLGASWGVYLTIAFCVPGAAMAYVSKKGIPFFKQMRFGMVVQALCLIGTLLVLFIMYGSDLGGAAADMLRGNLNMLTAEQKEAAVDIFRSLYGQMGAELPAATADEFFEEFINMFEQMIKLSVPMLIVMAVLLNGMIGPLWGNYIRARRGEAGVQFVPVRGWRLPPMITLGIAIGFIITLFIRSAQTAESEMIYLLVMYALITALNVQACASMLSRMFKSGVKAGKRTLICVLMLLFAGNFLMIYGAVSALFGSQGLFMPMIRKRMEDKNKEE